MRTPIRAALIAGGAAIALALGTAGALAATGGDDPARVSQDDGVRTTTPRPVPASAPPAVAVDDRSADDAATHDVGDDHGGHGRGHGSDD